MRRARDRRVLKAAKYLPCPWGGVLGTHGPTVFLEKRLCRGKGVVHFLECGICEQRTFGRGEFFARAGLGRGELPHGAVDGRGRPL